MTARQSSFLDALTAAVVEEVEAIEAATPFEFIPGDECEPRTLDDVPLELRLPGEPGYIERDRYYRPVSAGRGR